MLRTLTFVMMGFVAVSGVSAERFERGVIPQSSQPRVGNNLTILADNGERFEGRAWYAGRQGYFCFSGLLTTCGGHYDASSVNSELKFDFICLDGRSGSGVSNRATTSNTAEPLLATGYFGNGIGFLATFGPTKNYRDGVGCWY